MGGVNGHTIKFKISASQQSPAVREPIPNHRPPCCPKAKQQVPPQRTVMGSHGELSLVPCFASIHQYMNLSSGRWMEDFQLRNGQATGCIPRISRSPRRRRSHRSFRPQEAEPGAEPLEILEPLGAPKPLGSNTATPLRRRPA